MAKSELKAELGVPRDFFPVTPSDSTQFSPPLRAIRANGAGVIQVDTEEGSAPRLLNFLAGETRYVKVTRIYATNTEVVGVIEGGV